MDTNQSEIKIENKEPLLKNFKEEKKKEEIKEKVSLKQFFYFATNTDIFLMTIGTIAALGNGAAMPVFCIVFGDMAQSFSPTNTGQTIVDLASKYCLYFIYIGIGVFVLSFLMFACWMVTGTRQSIQYRKAYFDALLNQDIEWYDDTNPNELATKVAKDCYAVQNGMGEKISTCLMFFAMVISGFIVGITQGWKLALVIMASLPVMSVAGFIFVSVAQNYEKWTRNVYVENAANAEESITSIRTVKALSGEEHSKNLYGIALEKSKKLTLRYSYLCGLSLGFMIFAMFADYALGFWYGSVLIENREWNDITQETYTMGNVLTVFFAILISIMVIGQAQPAVKNITEGRVAAFKIWQMLARKPKIIIDDPSKLNVTDLEGKISMRNINFTYPARPDKPVLKEMNIEFLYQKKNALVGKSGCGKTTIMQLIERFYDPETGTVEIDNRDIKEYNLESLRKHIGYVGQEPVLFATSIRENLKYGNENATEEELIVALQQANVWDDINKRTEKKLDTFVGVGGAQFSGGQKQRIAIARAILKNPHILLLDEATSALDKSNEQAIQNTLDEISEGRTTIAIAHRLSTIQNADRIFVIDDGKVVEFGTHSELMEIENGFYKSLAMTQMLEEEVEEEIEQPKNELDEEEKLKFEKTVSGKEEDVRKSINQENEGILKKDEEKRKTKNVMSRIFQYNKGSFGYFFAACLGSLASGTIFPIYSILLSEMLKVLAMPYASDYRDRSNFFSIMYVVLGFAGFLFMFLSFCFGSIIGQRVTDKIRMETYDKIIKMPIKWHDEVENNSGALSSRLSTDCSTINALATSLYGAILSAVSSYITGMIIAFTASWKLTLIALGTSPFLMIVGSIQAKLAKGFSEKDDSYFKEAGLLIMESVTNIRTVASFGNEKLISKMYAEKVEKPKQKAISNGIKTGFAFGLSQILIYCIYALTFYCGAIFVRDDGLRMDQMFKAMFGIIMAAFGSGNASQYLPDIGKAQISADELFQIMDCVDEIQMNEKTKNFSKTADEIIGDIEFRNVYFKYPNRKHYVFVNLNMQFEGGKKVALVGSSGCGKSSIVSLLLRFYDIQKGEILLDGVNIKEYDLKTLRSYFGVVTQEPVLFSGTVEENICYNTVNVTKEEIEKAAQQSNALEFIANNEFDVNIKDEKEKNLGMGFQRKVGSKGSQISGGQKQRIAIARALLKKPKILLLDEATSALDGPSEAIVQNSLDQIMENKSSVTIAHRLATIKNHDKLFVFNDGRVVEEGTYDDLVKKKGYFYNFQMGQN